MNGNHRVPLIGEQQQALKAAILSSINSLSLQIYSATAADHIYSLDVHEDLNRDTLKKLAMESRAAAQAYFEALGILKPESPA